MGGVYLPISLGTLPEECIGQLSDQMVPDARRLCERSRERCLSPVGKSSAPQKTSSTSHLIHNESFCLTRLSCRTGGTSAFVKTGLRYRIFFRKSASIRAIVSNLRKRKKTQHSRDAGKGS